MPNSQHQLAQKHSPNPQPVQKLDYGAPLGSDVVGSSSKQTLHDKCKHAAYLIPQTEVDQGVG